MKKMLLIILAAILATFGAVHVHKAIFHAKHNRWAVYYNNKLPAARFASYDLIVFDRDSHPPLATLIDHHQILLGYVSLAEAEPWRADFAHVKSLGVLLPPDPSLSAKPYIDIRNPAWQDYLIKTEIPKILKQGFDGIMIDTADSAPYLQAQNPALYGGMQQAAIDIIKHIRARYPHIKIMLNRGFEILPAVAGDIDMELAESICSTGHGEIPDLFPNDVYSRYAQLLKDQQKQFPKLKIYTLDYWPARDIEGVKRLYARQRAQGFIPYVTSIDLQHLTPEPGVAQAHK